MMQWLAQSKLTQHVSNKSDYMWFPSTYLPHPPRCLSHPQGPAALGGQPYCAYHRPSMFAMFFNSCNVTNASENNTFKAKMCQRTNNSQCSACRVLIQNGVCDAGVSACIIICHISDDQTLIVHLKPAWITNEEVLVSLLSLSCFHLKVCCTSDRLVVLRYLSAMSWWAWGFCRVWLYTQTEHSFLSAPFCMSAGWGCEWVLEHSVNSNSYLQLEHK